MSKTHGPRVLLDGRLLGTRSGGIARYVDELARNLPAVASDLDVRLLVRSDCAGRTQRRTIPPIRTVTPPHHRLERWSLGLEATLRRPQLVHSPDFVQPLLPTARSIVTIHDLAFLEPDGEAALTPESLRYYRQVVRLAGRAQAIIAVSNYVKCAIIERLRVPESLVRVIYNGVTRIQQDESKAVGSDATQLAGDDELPGSIRAALEANRPIILMIGTVEPRKRHDLLLDALQISRSRWPDGYPFLVVAGRAGWNCDATFTRLRELEASGNGAWLSVASDRLLGQMLHHATLLVMPSRDEGFGLPVLEAMASGVPVVAAARGALPEIAGNAAMLAEGDTAEEWSHTIDSLLGDEVKRTRLRQAGLLRASEFSWERTAAETARLYREVLAQ